MHMLVVGLHPTDRDSSDGARVAALATALLPERFPEVVGHATAMTARPRLVEVAVVLHQGVDQPRTTLRSCVDKLIAELSAAHQVDGCWACHSPRLAGDPRPVW